jgi:hypothetical protein
LFSFSAPNVGFILMISDFQLLLLVICGIQNLAFDLSLAALLGENIYNFGELLAHPIVSTSFTYMCAQFFLWSTLALNGYTCP